MEWINGNQKHARLGSSWSEIYQSIPMFIEATLLPSVVIMDQKKETSLHGHNKKDLLLSDTIKRTCYFRSYFILETS